MSPAANAARGEVVRPVAGEPRRLCLTLGALAELEAALGCDGWEPLSARLRAVGARELLLVLAALLRGGGEAECAARLDTLRVTPAEAAEAVAAAFGACA